MSSDVSFVGFKIDETSSMVRRYADILLFALEHYPSVSLSRGLLYKVANRRAKAPHRDGNEVRSVTSAMGGVKKLLASDQHRCMLLRNADGYRLAVDDADGLINGVPPARRRFDNAGKNLATVVGLVDINAVPNTKDLNTHKASYKQLTESVIKKITSPSFLAALAIPGK